MEVTNDNTCSWINDLNPRSNIKSLLSNEESDWLIIGAGYTGLSAARKLGQINPNLKIILVDAQLAGEGASGRNSGYLVDTTLNDGFTSNKGGQDRFAANRTRLSQASGSAHFAARYSRHRPPFRIRSYRMPRRTPETAPPRLLLPVGPGAA